MRLLTGFITFLTLWNGNLLRNEIQGEEHMALQRLPPITAPQDGSAPDPLTPTLPLLAPDINDVPTDPLADAAPVETMDLETMDLEGGDGGTWYQWITPTQWVIPSPWQANFQIGMDGTDGNTQTFTFRGGAALQRKMDWSDLRVGLTYVRGAADRIETKHDAQLNVDHDWLFGDGPWSLFGKMQIEYDEFKAFDVRLVLNTGLGYRLIDLESTTLKSRVGVGTSREFNGPDNRWIPEAVFGMDFEHQLTDRQKLRATVEYFPAWDNFTDYRLRTDAGWQVLLDEATNMSLKLGILDRYDSTPNGRRPNDIDYSLLLIWEL